MRRIIQRIDIGKADGDPADIRADGDRYPARSLIQFGLFLDFSQQCPVGILEDLKPVVAEPCAELFRPQDEWHPVVIWRNAGVGRGGQHGELAAISIRLPQAGHRKQRFAGLDEADAFLKKSVGENQAAVLQVRLERGQLGDGFALGIDERLFVPRHAPDAHATELGGVERCAVRSRGVSWGNPPSYLWRVTGAYLENTEDCRKKAVGRGLKAKIKS